MSASSRTGSASAGDSLRAATPGGLAEMDAALAPARGRARARPLRRPTPRARPAACARRARPADAAARRPGRSPSSPRSSAPRPARASSPPDLDAGRAGARLRGRRRRRRLGAHRADRFGGSLDGPARRRAARRAAGAAQGLHRRRVPALGGARRAGAAAVLLHRRHACATTSLRALLGEASDCGLDALVEVHDEARARARAARRRHARRHQQPRPAHASRSTWRRPSASPPLLRPVRDPVVTESGIVDAGGRRRAARAPALDAVLVGESAGARRHARATLPALRRRSASRTRGVAGVTLRQGLRPHARRGRAPRACSSAPGRLGFVLAREPAPGDAPRAARGDRSRRCGGAGAGVLTRRRRSPRRRRFGSPRPSPTPACRAVQLSAGADGPTVAAVRAARPPACGRGRSSSPPADTPDARHGRPRPARRRAPPDALRRHRRRPLDWEALAADARRRRAPTLVLAGGLAPTTSRAAIARLRPVAVDVVERRRDRARRARTTPRLREFFAAVVADRGRRRHDGGRASTPRGGHR